MKRIYCLVAAVFLLITISEQGCSTTPENKDVLFQTSTINALMEGAYDGNIKIGELKKLGNFGLGTFDGLDGEMIVLDGVYYQVKTDGKAYIVDDSVLTPFAAVTFFEPDIVASVDKVLNYEQLVQYLDGLLPTENIFYAVKIDGVFKYIKARSVPKQIKPYPPLAEVVKIQSVFEFYDIAGSIVGLRCPSYVSGLNVADYHLHFITRDKLGGGHVLECATQNVKVEIDNTSGFYLGLPQSTEFYHLDLTGEKQTELNQVEKGSDNK